MKMLMFMMTGNILFLFMPFMQALLFSMIMPGLGGSLTGGTGTLTSTGLTSSNMMLPLLLMSTQNKKRYYRPRTRVVNRYYGRRRY